MQADTEHALFTCVSLHSACTGIHITENLLRRHECRRAILLIAYRRHIYTTIHLRNWFPFPDPLEIRFYSKDEHQWNHSETTVKHRPPKNMNMQHNEHIHDTRSNSQWKIYKNGTMQIYPITMRWNATWYWILNNHEPRARCMHCTHSLQLTAQTVLVYVCVCANYKIHCNAWGISKLCVDSSCLWDREYNIISFNFKLLA